MRAPFYILVLFILPVVKSSAQQNEAKKIESYYFKKLYRINDSVYRSEQPLKKGFRELETMGIKTILNLRRLRDDTRKAKGTGLHLEHLRLKSGEITEQDIIEALRLLKDAEKPVLIHCWHGSDRTGVVTAAYRIIFENWPKEKAIKEFMLPEFGYHRNWYPNLLELLDQLNVSRIKKELGI
ncbi:tyrosine-protein phosphatase [Ascidiimonas aurantiaca]|uniref:phosphatase domain-containing putative toxin n=1 Tax=Ascidiimonas aurantiaca TaxID=1685432 RepID=UPI0030EBEE63